MTPCHLTLDVLDKAGLTKEHAMLYCRESQLEDKCEHVVDTGMLSVYMFLCVKETALFSQQIHGENNRQREEWQQALMPVRMQVWCLLRYSVYTCRLGFYLEFPCTQGRGWFLLILTLFMPLMPLKLCSWGKGWGSRKNRDAIRGLLWEKATVKNGDPLHPQEITQF